jgi:hypothetical protein
MAREMTVDFVKAFFVALAVLTVLFAGEIW